MKSFTLTINQKKVSISAEPDMPLLWALRELAGMTGTKYGCGTGLCGACTVLLGGNAIRACSYPVSAVGDQAITTIEHSGNPVSEALKQAWVEHQVPQCGYCQPGQIMSATALLSTNDQPSEEEVDAWMTGNICRCGTYPRIKAAIMQVAEQTRRES